MAKGRGQKPGDGETWRDGFERGRSHSVARKQYAALLVLENVQILACCFAGSLLTQFDGSQVYHFPGLLA